MILLRILRTLIKPVAWLLYGLRHEGRENIPSDGAFIIASNHVHLIDPALHVLCNRRTFKIMAKNELMHAGLVSPLLRALGAFGVKRGTGDRAALDKAVEYLKRGDGLLIFPEGTRSKTGELGGFKPGVAYIQNLTGAPIIPAAIIARRGMPVFSKVVVRYGRPIMPGEGGADLSTPAGRKELCALIRSRVLELYPENGSFGAVKNNG